MADVPIEPIYVTALYDFSATQSNHLSLREGDVILVLKQENTGWWSGMSTSGQSGWFPESASH
jgi:son of sevenless-like protein